MQCKFQHKQVSYCHDNVCNCLSICQEWFKWSQKIYMEIAFNNPTPLWYIVLTRPIARQRRFMALWKLVGEKFLLKSCARHCKWWSCGVRSLRACITNHQIRKFVHQICTICTIPYVRSTNWSKECTQPREVSTWQLRFGSPLVSVIRTKSFLRSATT